MTNFDFVTGHRLRLYCWQERRQARLEGVLPDVGRDGVLFLFQFMLSFFRRALLDGASYHSERAANILMKDGKSAKKPCG